MNSRNGLIAAAIAYILWGLLPIYWHALSAFPALEILVNRVVWSLVFVLILMAARREWSWLRQVRQHPRLLSRFVVTALLLSVNWLVYIWANNSGHIVEASLGYFITPLVNVLLGLAILHERLRVGQWLAVGVAALGVLYLTVNAGGLLWIALVLAFSFGFYGLLRKTSRFGSLQGLSLEMGILFLPSLVYLLSQEAAGTGAFRQSTPLTQLLLVGTGIVTAVPLLLFAYGAQRVPLSALGILQYIAPTLQFLLGVLVYGEAFTTTRLIGFGVIWLALAIYTFDGVMTRRRQNALARG